MMAQFGNIRANLTAGGVVVDPSIIPINPANRSAAISVERIVIPSTSNHEGNIGIADISVQCRNYYENDWGLIIFTTYPHALDAALLYMAPTNSFRVRVRVYIQNIRVDTEEGFSEETLISDTRPVFLNNKDTINYLTSSLDLKYGEDNNEANPGSGTNFVLWRPKKKRGRNQVTNEDEGYPFTVNYQFHFIPMDPTIGLGGNNGPGRRHVSSLYAARQGRLKPLDPNTPYIEMRTPAARAREAMLTGEHGGNNRIPNPLTPNAFRDLTPQARANLTRISRSSRAVGDEVGAAPNAETVYGRAKKKLYIRKTLGDAFSRTTALKSTPITGNDMCFPMAFMMCQVRTIRHAIGSTDIADISEGYRHIIRLDPEALDQFPEYLYQEKVPFLDTSTWEITLFCSDKERDPTPGSKLYLNEANDYSECRKMIWHWCATQVHAFVEYALDEEVSFNNLHDSCEAYCKVFGVNVIVVSAHTKGQRLAIASVDRTVVPLEERFIHMHLEGMHLHAISNVREYFRSEVNPKNCSIHSYCDYCGGFSLKWTRDFKHHNRCSASNSWQTSADYEQVNLLALKPPPKVKGVMGKGDMCGNCKQLIVGCRCGNTQLRKVQIVICATCKKEVPRNHYNFHECYMQPKAIPDPLPRERIFVWDIEACQEHNEEIGQSVHECILVCLRAVYDDRRWYFENIEDFVKFVTTDEQMFGSTILGHNGGGYDDQFLLQYVEANDIQHSVVPRPNSLHKFLRLTLHNNGGDTVTHFTDFMMLMTNSLKNIGEGFKLNVCKGDFPHNFSRRKNLDYVGPLPDLDHPDDYYCFRTVKSAKDLAESRAYWESQKDIYCTCPSNDECICSKQKWNFRAELLKYCWLDVDVLAGACQAYRDQTLKFGEEASSAFEWNMPESVDPFNCMTQSQVALTLFTAGKHKTDIHITREKVRDSFKPEQIQWLEYLMDTNPDLAILHAGNYHKEWYDVDSGECVCGYCPQNRKVYEYYDCLDAGCPTCYGDKVDSLDIHPTRGVPWKFVMGHTASKIQKLMFNNVYSGVVIHWSHDNHVFADHDWDPLQGELMTVRSLFYGGRTEVFAAYCEPAKMDMKIQYDDVCSLYPYVCSYKELPTGIPNTYMRHAIDISRLSLDCPPETRYFGFVRAHIRPNKKDLIGVLPQRTNGKLCYDLHDKVGCWHTEFIYLALKRGYEIVKVYEVWHWPPDQRTDQSMRGYMEFFLRLKQEAEGWRKLGQDLYSASELIDPTPDKIEAICDYIERCNGGMARPRPSEVSVNPVKRQLAKIFLNCLWGKLAQKNPGEIEQCVHGHSQYIKLLSNPVIDFSSLRFRQVKDSFYKARYRLKSTREETGLYVNIPMAASVTAHAQSILMNQMFVVGEERVLYCDTDSIIYLRAPTDPPFTKSGLGNWADEFPGDNILKYLALAPKSYVMNVEDGDDVFKCKGVRTTEENRRRTPVEKLEGLVAHSFFGSGLESIQAETMTIHPNSTNSNVPYATMLTRYGYKKIRTVYSKRHLEPNQNPGVDSMSQMALVRLTPFGYEGNHSHVYTT